MKKVLYIIVMFIGVTFYTTENDVDRNQDLSDQRGFRSGGINYGQMQNDILEIYYVDYDYNSNDISLMENSVEEYLVENESPLTIPLGQLLSILKTLL